MTNSYPTNHVKPLVDSRGTLVSDFSKFSDQDLRSALYQMIDGLERLDEIYEGMANVGGDWRDANLNNSWRETMKKLRPTESILPDQDAHKYSQWKDINGKDCVLSDMKRADVEHGIRQAWEFSRRFARIFNLAAAEARLIMKGDYLQPEIGKPEVEAKAVPPTLPRVKGPR